MKTQLSTLNEVMITPLSPSKVGLTDYRTNVKMNPSQLGRISYFSGASSEFCNPYPEWSEAYTQFIEAYDLARWEDYVSSDTRTIAEIDAEF